VQVAADQATVDEGRSLACQVVQVAADQATLDEGPAWLVKLCRLQDSRRPLLPPVQHP
jgi:hypothetical protein